MKYNKNFYQSYLLLYVILVLFLAVNTLLLAFVDFNLMLASLFITVIGAAFVIYKAINIQSEYRNFVNALKKGSLQNSTALSSFNLPVIYVSDCDEIVWYNQRFKQCIKAEDCYGKNVYDFLQIDPAALHENGSSEIKLNDKEYSVYYTDVVADRSALKLFYLVENTNLKRAAREYVATRPVVMIMATDNFSEIMRNARDSEKSSFRSAIHNEIEKWLSDINCISIFRNEKYVFVLMEERFLNRLVSDKFSVLDSVRRLKIGNYSGVTLSIGVGRGGKNMAECEHFCKQGLEMAQSRGGDQVAIKSNGNDYKFFGGISQAAEKRSTVKARVISSALSEMIASAENVVIMGHKYSDLDCLGAAYALSCVSRFLGKRSYIVFDSKRTMANSLYKRILAEDSNCIFTDGGALNEIINDKTLLIIADTHRSGFVENEEIYRMCKNIIVIDHHRKSVDAIDNSVIFYHETAASSACEMVTELIQYMDSFTPDSTVSDALLAGIMLDTKSLCLHTGVRTFEASAYLRSCGADPVKVKRLFADSFETYSRKSSIISNSKLYGSCAISFDEIQDDKTRIATSQAADELLNLEGVKASFVMCKIAEGINISARSYGDVNVQLVMEALGGGGHRNMAACQVMCSDFIEAEEILKKEIDNHNMNKEMEC